MTRFLIADDDEQSRYMLQVLLDGHGYQVVSVQNGAEALAVARSDPPDMIVSDILMPVMDGFALCREWKADERLKTVPFVFYTATYTDPKDEAFALSLGAERFIVKPVEPDVLVEMLLEVFEAHQAGRLIASHEPAEEETVYLQGYSEALIRKLEGKMLELEKTNRALEQEILERSHAEAERESLLRQVQEQAQQLQQIMTTVPQGLLLLDADLRVLSANPPARESLALLAEAEVGDTLTHLAGQPLRELLISPPQGLWHEVEAKGPPCQIFEVIARPMEEGPATGGWVLVLQDVTQQREVQERLRRHERLAAVGQLAAGIAHDFNNVLGGIVLYAQLAARAPGLPAKVGERLEAIRQQAWRATELIQQIMDFSRRTVLKRRPLDLVLLLGESVKLLERTLPENIRIELAYGAEEAGVAAEAEAYLESAPFLVNADSTRLQQVFMNLAINARDAMPEGGELRIELERIRVEDSAMAPLPEMAPQRTWRRLDEAQQSKADRDVREWVCVKVSDSGTGIQPDVLPHIFEPFFTTKASGEGAGLGLAQVHGIVAQHEGHIDVATQVGKGTTFAVYLPAEPVHRAEPLALERVALVEGRGEIVLVVEDDAAVREALVASLQMLNYRVLEATNGQEALAMVEGHSGQAGRDSGPIALVLTDLVMPEMGGKALAQALQRQAPAVRVVVMSGHPMEDAFETLREAGVVSWLKKPPDLDQLAQTVAQALGRGTEGVAGDKV